MIKFRMESNLNDVKENKIVELTKQNHIVYFLDFGLSFISANVEDKAVDLSVLEKAFLSTHTESEKECGVILETYRTKSKKGPQTIARLDEGMKITLSINTHKSTSLVRKRGRKKLAFG